MKLSISKDINTMDLNDKTIALLQNKYVSRVL